MKEEMHKHFGAKKLHPVSRVHREPNVKRAHARALKKALEAKHAKKARKSKTPVKRVTKSKKAKKPTLKERVKKAVKKVTGTGIPDYGRAPTSVPTYEPIPSSDFNPRNPPEGYILVKMDHKLLDEMLRAMSAKSNIRAVAVPCKRIN